MTDSSTCQVVDLPDASAIPVSAGPGLADPLSLLGDVEVKLEFVLGSTTLPVADLNQLAPGTSIPMDEDRGSVVTIRLNGVDVGHGVLVTVDGVLGVQIRHIEQRA